MGRAIFISYRRDDTEGEAGRLFDDLVRSFGDDSVFMDVAGINPGMDFRKAIDDNVASCGVLLAMIGPAWCSMKNGAGARRLDDPNDFVRLEIASALARNIAVIPVLVHDAKMPRPEELPDSLKDLAFRNSVEITHARWNSDVQLLTQALTRYVAPTAPSDTAPVHATVAVQLPPPTAPTHKPRSSRPSSVPLILGIVAAAVVALGIVAYFMFRAPAPVPQPGPVTPANVVTPPAPAPVPNPLVGTWTNTAPIQQNGLAKVEISPNGERALSIHAWGQCAQTQCDWGTQDATFDGQLAQASWQFGAGGAGTTAKRTAVVIIRPENQQLSVTVTNTYADLPSNQHEFTFVKAQ